MIDRIFTATLAFALLAGASFAFTDEFLSGRAQMQAQVVQLPRVVITGQVQPERTDIAQAALPATGAASATAHRQ